MKRPVGLNWKIPGREGLPPGRHPPAHSERVHLLGEALQRVGVAALVGLEVLHAGLWLLGDDGRRRLVAPAGVGRTAVVVEVQTVGIGLLAGRVPRVERGESQTEPGARLAHLAAVAGVSLPHGLSGTKRTTFRETTKKKEYF